MKSYGTRTLEGNWWEERQNLEAYCGRKLDMAEMTVDLHVSAKAKNPDLVYDDKTPMKSSYAIDTDPENLAKQKRLIKKVQQIERRKLQVGTESKKGGVPEESLTMKQLSTRFYDPMKTRYKTVYQKTFCHPEFETTRALRESQQKPQESFFDARKETLDLSWN